MGGYGSGRHRIDKRRCVEDGLTLRASGFHAVLVDARDTGRPVTGTTAWSYGSGVSDRIGFTYTPRAASPDALAGSGGGIGGRLVLAYDRLVGDARSPVSVDVPVEVRPCPFGGWRLYLRCPLTRNGRTCGRRCEKLYLPPGSSCFGCRTCHDLTYRSAQQAHHFDGLFKRLGREMGMDPRTLERALTDRIGA